MEILEKCLKACDDTLSTAADLLSQVKERKVLNELFNSAPGIEKAQGMSVRIQIINILCIVYTSMTVCVIVYGSYVCITLCRLF